MQKGKAVAHMEDTSSKRLKEERKKYMALLEGMKYDDSVVSRAISKEKAFVLALIDEALSQRQSHRLALIYIEKDRKSFLPAPGETAEEACRRIISDIREKMTSYFPASQEGQEPPDITKKI